MALPVVMSAMLGAIAFMVVDSALDDPPALFGGGTTKVEAAQKRQRKQERRRQERRRNSSPAKLIPKLADPDSGRLRPSETSNCRNARKHNGISAPCSRADDGAHESTSPQASISAAQALEILGLKAGATEQEIRAAYTRLMKRVHPDFGESNFFAAQLNEVTQLSCGRGADRATLLEVVEGSTNIDGNTTAILGLCSFSCTATSRHGSGRAALSTRVAVRSAICGPSTTSWPSTRSSSKRAASWPSRLLATAEEDRLNISPWPGEIYGCLEFGSSTCAKRSLFMISVRSSPTSSPMLMFRNCASNASCPIMSCVSGNSFVRSWPLYFILRAKSVRLARSSCGVVAWGCSTGPDCEFC